MSASKSRRVTPFETARFELSHAAKATIHDLLAFPTNLGVDSDQFGRVVREVENWRLVASVCDNDYLAPALGVYPRVLASICHHVVKLRERVRSLPPLVKARLGSKGVSLHQVEMVLASLEAASTMLGRELKSEKPGKGRKDRVLLYELVRNLRGVFQKHYLGPRAVGMKRGAITRRSDHQRREIAFVKLALSDLGKHLYVTDDKLARLFRQARCTP